MKRKGKGIGKEEEEENEVDQEEVKGEEGNNVRAWVGSGHWRLDGQPAMDTNAAGWE